MIIDIPYIKTVLDMDIEDEQCISLINNLFNYMCNYLQVETSLEAEEISLEYLNSNIIPNISEDDLTLFQETMIYGIACHADMFGISVSQEIYDQNIDFLDIEALIPNQDGTYNITYCDLFNNCLKVLKDYLNENTSIDTSSVEYLRKLLRLHPDDVSDEEIDFLISHYTDYLSSIIPNVDVNSPLFKQALYTQIACHIFRTNPDSIVSPASYKVDEVAEWFEIAFDKFNNTWCDLADAALSDLKKQTYGYYGLRTYDRPGARTKYGGYGPSSRL